MFGYCPTSFVRGDVGKNDFHHPADVHLVTEEIVSLAGVAAKVIDHRKLRRYDWLVETLAIAKPDFDVVRLDRHERTVRPEEKNAVATGGLSLALEASTSGPGTGRACSWFPALAKDMCFCMWICREARITFGTLREP